MKLLAIPALLAAVFVTAPAQAKLNVFACEPEWGALVTELAGDKVDLEVATTALQDVHVIEAKPSLIAKVRAADLVVCTGADPSGCADCPAGGRRRWRGRARSAAPASSPARRP